MNQDPHDILGVRKQASPEEIKKAYRDKVKKYHPDHYKDHPLEDLAKEKMQQVNEAYRLLTQKRRSDDANPSQTSQDASWPPPDSAWQSPRQGPYYQQPDSAGTQLCNALSCLCCADACCSCFGGDLCGC